ncbi:unnamed protein product [Echinostoma caproni]|uniref:Macro domain-containing protein n=1 Tax=Echinostoma caproni TaxID=27848 RepID=A0A3P8GMD1_9TREM|nr:unnamed protein product [Echinostoma caproni]
MSVASASRKPLSAEELAERARKKLEADATRMLKAQEAKARRTAAKLEKRKAKWNAVGYQSRSVYANVESPDENTPAEDPTEWTTAIDDADVGGLVEENTSGSCPPGIYYKSGDAAEPLTKFDALNESNGQYTPVFVCACVDDSGGWGTRGFFGALSRRTNVPSMVYELAGTMDDLELGQCHLVPVFDPSEGDGEQSGVSTFGDWLLTRDSNSPDNPIRANFCALLVAQQHSRRSQSKGDPPDLQLDALDSALSALSKACRAVKQCSVHLPRLGHGTHAFTWYSVERLLRKHLVERGHVPVYVYP